ncbi:protein kinase [Streptacidiphilus sp. P02-A3a]|uniref:protein kinase n=1 Tax=Streptacidiphilus sp. P02-A3a TaxID=2704468 RepID=UPI0015F8AA75|nr:protein kinase [Streptacidiphilus sp. P02-A3a]QMU68068.1 protein kinase [Streptacidiphilus sp. P02-A3a]
MNPEIQELIAPYTGTVRRVAVIDAGYRADVTASVEADRGRFFVKAFKEAGTVSEPREVALNPYVAGIGPALVGHARSESWTALVYVFIEGRHADLSPSSPDIARVVSLIDHVGRVRLPESGPWRHRTWRDVATADEARLLDGGALLHSDINPENFLVDGTQAWLVDWSSPFLGAAVVNLGELVTQLIAAGHSPAEAEHAVSGCEVWADAEPGVIDALARVLARMHRGWERDRPGWRARFPEGSWHRAISPAVEAWASYRLSTSGHD